MKEPFVFAETGDWALLVKPHGLPSAPIRAGETDTLLEWYLQQYPEGRLVRGMKEIECGLLHRLDTGTEGFVLIAKNQKTYDYLFRAQKMNELEKTYTAFCTLLPGKALPSPDKIPLHIVSKFRSFGPQGREVRPLFPGMRGYTDVDAEYETIVRSIEPDTDAATVICICTLVRGYRHQIRAHLAWLGLPICGDVLYNCQTLPETGGELQLYATGLSFPDPVTNGRVSFSLPKPDKRNR